MRSRTRVAAPDTSRGFTEGEWLLVRTIADGVEWSNGWDAPAVRRLRFNLDFACAAGLPACELIGATRHDIPISARISTTITGGPWLAREVGLTKWRYRRFRPRHSINFSCIAARDA
ncbi:Integrase [Cupriavidus basilensis]|uniref:Integrase n=1 Tax=Cupriavidus basilensis TaxID=68895 RepID=A0A0C4YEU7_9BURK|nr:hypothetical protein [Cupriavidus basilensis]AJG24257.1 Integrase [Cupriavidus basilensis]